MIPEPLDDAELDFMRDELEWLVQQNIALAVANVPPSVVCRCGASLRRVGQLYLPGMEIPCFKCRRKSQRYA